VEVNVLTKRLSTRQSSDPKSCRENRPAGAQGLNKLDRGSRAGRSRSEDRLGGCIEIIDAWDLAEEQVLVLAEEFRVSIANQSAYGADDSNTMANIGAW
jgi:hypothetical protein